MLGVRLSRADFEQMIRPVIDRTLQPCRQALADAGLQASQVDEVVLVGGSTRIPLVHRLVGELFGRTPHSELNPDEVVAIGAAVQADILVTGNRDMLLLDVTPLSLGIETMGGVVSKIILRNSTIPATGSEMFTSGVDNQTAVDIHVLQGERELVGDNRSLARFRLRGIPPMPAGMPRVQVQFQIDANGILSVTASELRTNVEQTIEVKPSYGLTDEQVEQMLIDSFEHAEADFAARMLIDARNEAESVITATEKTLRAPEFPAVAAEELASGEQKRIEQALAGLKHVIQSDDREAILLWTKVLNDATRHLAEVMMNRSVQAALAGKNIDRLGSGFRLRAKASGRGPWREPEADVAQSREPKAESLIMPKVTFIIDGESQTVEFEHGKLPYSHHGKPESFLDVAKNLDVRWSTRAAAAARARPATSSSARARRT